MTRWDIRPLTDSEIKSAQDWYGIHTDFVDSLLHFADTQKSVLSIAISPGGEDAPHPNLWKYNHWAWFIREGHI